MSNRTDPRIDKSVAGWFLTLRWGTVLCQVLLFAAVQLLFGMTVPLLVTGLIAFEVVSNLFFTWLLREKKRVPSPLFSGVMFLDIALLTALIALTGGAMNPFTFLYLVHVVVGAILLPMTMAWGLAAFSAACYGIFFIKALKLPTSGAPQAVCHPLDLSPEMNLHLQGMWLAFVITAFFVVFFVTRIQQALVAHRETRAQLREEQFKNERLASLAALSAGAAHEFATPLSTIAVAAGELYREMSQVSDQGDRLISTALPETCKRLQGTPDARKRPASNTAVCEQASDKADGVPCDRLRHEAWLDDLRLIRSQVTRCRDILYQMAADAGEPLGEGMVTISVGDLMDEVRASLDEQRQPRLVIESPSPGAMMTVPRRSLHRVLRGLVSNAFQASEATATVRLRTVADNDMVHFEIIDQGHGMDAATARLASEPFFTTKPAGQGLGLGLYLARTLAERLGGGLSIDSTPEVGTTVRFWIARKEERQ